MCHGFLVTANELAWRFHFLVDPIIVAQRTLRHRFFWNPIWGRFCFSPVSRPPSGSLRESPLWRRSGFHVLFDLASACRSSRDVPRYIPCFFLTQTRLWTIATFSALVSSYCLFASSLEGPLNSPHC